VVKVRPERPPKPEPKPPRVPELMVDDIPQNAFTKKWKGAWGEADLPQDLLKVLAKLDPPDEVTGKEDPTAYYQSGLGIYMKSHASGEGRGNNAYRHEFGHYVDDMIGKTVSLPRAKILAGIFRSDKNHDFADLSPSDRLKRWDEGAKKLRESIANDSGEILAREIEAVRRVKGSKASQKVVEDQARKNLANSVEELSKGRELVLYGSQLTNDLYEMVGLPRIPREEAGELLDKLIENFGRRNITPFVSDTPEWAKAMKTESRQMEEEKIARSGGDKSLKSAYLEVGESVARSKALVRDSTAFRSAVRDAVKQATMDAVKKAAQENPAFDAISRLVERHIPAEKVTSVYRMMVSPTGALASRAEILEGLKYLSDAPEVFSLFDAVGATTKNKIGWGHSDSYYTGEKQQATEVFANLTDMHAYSADSRAIAEYFLPIQYAEYKRVLAEFGNS
jgi:hypothetical protein